MRDRPKERAAQRFNAAMQEVLDAAWNGAEPTDARKAGHVHILRQDPFLAHPPRLMRVEDDGDVRTSVGLCCLDVETQGPGWQREPVRLVLQIGETATGAPLASSALQRGDAVFLAIDLLTWLDVVAGAGGFDGGLVPPRIKSALTELVSRADGLRRTLASQTAPKDSHL